MTDEPDAPGETDAPAADSPDTAETEAKPTAWWRREGRFFVEVFALCGIAFAQPTLDILTKNIGLFITRGTTGLQAIALVLLVLLVPPLVFWFVAAALGAAIPSARRWFHAAIAGLLIAVIADEVLKKQTSLGPTALVVLAIAIGVAGGACVLRAEAVRLFLRYLALAPLVFGLMFLTTSSVSEVVFGGGAAATASATAKHPKRVVMVVFDELPDMSLLDGSGHIDSELYPNFAALAGDATWYRNETTVASFTVRAVPAILTGTYPDRTAYPGATEYPRNLFTLLGSAYTMNVHEPVTRLCPDRLCGSATGSRFGSLLNQSARLWHAFASPHRSQTTFDWEEGLSTALADGRQFPPTIVAATEPRLDFAHIELPHNPWLYLPTLQDGASYPKVTAEWTNTRDAMLARQRHLLQVQATDTVLGRIINKLKRAGAYDDSLVVVTADHGVAFTKNEPTRSATLGNYPQIMWPPLLIKYPNERAGRVDDRPAQSIDILPTIADVLGMKIPWHVDGESLLGPVRPDMPRRMYQAQLPSNQGGEVPSSPKGQDFVTFDAAQGFPHVLKGQAAPAGGDRRLRLYRLGPYGDLVGKRSGPLVTGTAGSETAAIRDISRFDRVNPAAARLPWFHSTGLIAHLDHDAWVAVAMNDTVVATVPTAALSDSSATFEFVVPPKLVRPGKNRVSTFLVTGSPRAPHLTRIPLVNQS